MAKRNSGGVITPITHAEREEVYQRAVRWMERNKQTSLKPMAKALNIGPRTARTALDRMEREGIIGESSGSGGHPRKFIPREDRKNNSGPSLMAKQYAEISKITLFGTPPKKRKLPEMVCRAYPGINGL